MNKAKFINDINKISNKQDFEDIKVQLLEFRSLKNRVMVLEYKIGGASSSGTSIVRYGCNNDQLIETLIKIVSDYSLKIEAFCQIKSFFKYFIDKVQIKIS